MHTWIFQGNPDRFDLDSFFASQPVLFVWLVTRYPDEMKIGDRVFIYRTGGELRTGAGIIAEAQIVEVPKPRPEEPDALPFWRGNDIGAGNEILPRALLRLVKTAGTREILRREWLLEDPVLRDLPNLQMAAATNYPVGPEHAARLSAVWDRTGVDWTRNESLAGLWAYAQTHGQSVSKAPGSPVAEVALLIGRVVSGVYNKVMNFRAIDPRDERAGMSGAGAVDRRVWNEFYDPAATEIRLSELEHEFNRLWRGEGDTLSPSSDLFQDDAAFQSAVKAFTEAGLPNLLVRYNREQASRSGRPSTRATLIRRYDRSPLVVAIARLRAGYRCEMPNCNHPLFFDQGGLPYSEVHHIEPLSEGGEDTLENVVCLCPAHHREVHVGSRATALTEVLRTVRLGDGETKEPN